MAEKTRYLILSHEHGAWWRPNSRGYTVDVTQAGQYDEKEARAICENANRDTTRRNEEMVPLQLASAIVALERYRVCERAKEERSHAKYLPALQ